MDGYPGMPVEPDRVLPQPAIHRGITAAEVRPVMPADIDPFDPDRTHNLTLFQPVPSRIEH